MDTITLLATIIGCVICLGTCVGLIYIVYRFRHGILRALGVITLIFLALVAIAIVATYAKGIVYLVPLAILIFIVWLFIRK